MNFFDQRTARVLITILLFAAVIGFLWLARKPLIVFLFAMLFAYLLEPLIAFVQPRVRNSRPLAILTAYVLGAVLIGTFLLVVGPRIVDEGRKLAHSAPELYERIWSGDIAWQWGARRGWSRETTEKVQQFLLNHREEVIQNINSLGVRAASLATNAGWVVLIPVLAVFLLRDKSRFSQALQELVGDSQDRSLLQQIFAELDQMVAHFVRAQLYLAMISGLVYTLVLSLLRVPYGFVLGAIGGFLEFVPVVGPLVAAVIILAVAFTTNYGHLVVLVLFLVAWRVVQDYAVSPRILGRNVELHPLAAIFGVLVGGEIAGVIGVYLAIPAMATIRILWRVWHRHEAAPQEMARTERKAG